MRKYDPDHVPGERLVFWCMVASVAAIALAGMAVVVALMANTFGMLCA